MGRLSLIATAIALTVLPLARDAAAATCDPGRVLIPQHVHRLVREPSLAEQIGHQAHRAVDVLEEPPHAPQHPRGLPRAVGVPRGERRARILVR